jgi:hypothetical protein
MAYAWSLHNISVSGCQSCRNERGFACNMTAICPPLVALESAMAEAGKWGP